MISVKVGDRPVARGATWFNQPWVAQRAGAGGASCDAGAGG